MKVKLEPWAKYPVRAHEDDAGLDLYIAFDRTIGEREYATIDTGVHVQIPAGHFGKIESRSGMMSRGITAMGGVIDCGYTGSISLCLENHNDYPVDLKAGQKVAQLIVIPCLMAAPEPARHLEETERGDKGFGSTGSF